MHWLIRLILLCLSFAPWILPLTHAQLTGDQAELRRLRDNAEEAMSMGDPQGAALNSGKAALMASFMAKQEPQLIPQAHFHSLEAMLRAQEHVYRAIALFQQSGEPIPASSGTCGTIALASSHQKKAESFLPNTPSTNPLFQNLPVELHEWEEIIEELHTDFRCRNNTIQ